MSHWVVAPILLPLVTGALLLVVGRAMPRTAAALGLASTAALLALALLLLARTHGGEVHAYLLGNWRAPFGVALAADRLAALMLTLTAVTALASLIAARDGAERLGPNFHALFQLQLIGLNGAFLTADLFNLFVFFEVLLIASYALLLHGGGLARLRASIHYVVLNLTASMLFLIAAGLLYGVLGTLNLADLAIKAARVPAQNVALVQAAGFTLLVVFGVKAALVPLHFWLPGTYTAAAAPVAALFAIMTKVGAYAILRVFTLVFGEDAGPLAHLASPWLIPLALVTLGAAALGALAAQRLGETVAWLVIVSTGTLLAAIGLYSRDGIAAGLVYVVHTTLISAALFLIVALVARERGAAGDALAAGPAPARAAVLGALFTFGAVAIAGLPPLSGFVAKVFVLESASGSPWHVSLWAVLLGASVLVIVALARAGSMVFWKTADGGSAAVAKSAPLPVATLAAIGMLAAASLFVVGAAAPLHRYASETASQLLSPQRYIDTVMGTAPVRRDGEDR